VLTYNDQRYSTQAISKTVNPVWNAVFDVTITQGERSELIEAVCWDRDRFSKKYLGEFGLSIADIFTDGPLSLYDPNNQVELIFYK
jgi:phosphatidylserine decarboxylase